MQVFIKCLIVTVVFLSLTSPAVASHQEIMSVTIAGLGSTPRQATPVATTVAIDIKPGSCPNLLYVKKQAKLPVAILGTETFDVTMVDIGLIELAGAVPVHAKFADAATPIDESSASCACTTEGPDGYLDLVLKFKPQDILDGLGMIEDGDVISLTLTGALSEEYGSTSIEGSDCVIIRSKKQKTK